MKYDEHSKEYLTMISESHIGIYKRQKAVKMKKVFLLVLVFVFLAGGTTRSWYIDQAGTGNKSAGDSWASDHAIKLDTLQLATITAGDTIFLKGGTHTLTANFDQNALAGTAVAPISMIGVAAATTHTGSAIVYADWIQDTTARPYINASTNQFRVGNYWILRNLNIAGAYTYAARCGTYCLISNCCFNQTAAANAIYYALYGGNQLTCFNSKFISANCNGLNNNIGCIAFCVFQGLYSATASCGIGLTCGTNYNVAIGCIFDSCQVGILGGGHYGEWVINNTFYKCNKGVSLTTDNASCFVNNIFEGCVANGIIATTQTNENFYWGNHGNDTRDGTMWSGVDVSGVFSDYKVTSGDPKFKTLKTNFQIASTSPAISNTLGYGPYTYPWIKGAVLTPDTVGGTCPTDTFTYRLDTLINYTFHHVRDSVRFDRSKGIAYGIKVNGDTTWIDTFKQSGTNATDSIVKSKTVFFPAKMTFAGAPDTMLLDTIAQMHYNRWKYSNADSTQKIYKADGSSYLKIRKGKSSGANTLRSTY